MMDDTAKEDLAAMVKGAERLAQPWRRVAMLNGLLCGAVLTFVFLRHETKTNRRPEA